MKKQEYANYLRNHHLKKSDELSNSIGVPKKIYEEMVKKIPDQGIIDSYRICSCCGREWISKTEMDALIQEWNDPERILNEIPSGHE